MILDDSEGVELRAELTSVLARLFERVAPLDQSVARAEMAIERGYDRELWERLNGEVGIVGLVVPEELGGAGAGLAEAAVVSELVGRRADALPWLGTLLCVQALATSGGEAAQRWLEPLVEGRAIGTVSWAEGLLAKDDDNGWQVSGEVDLVVDGSTADVLIARAETDDARRWFAVDLSEATRTRRDCLDLTRDLTHLSLSGVRATALEADESLGGTLTDYATVALAVEQLGVAEQCVEDAVAYAGTREQFGRTIGSFQAVKHTLADLATEADLARSLVEHALWASTADPTRFSEAAAMAMLAASGAAVTASAENVQIHGGIGFSWEHRAHLYFRKARSNEVLLGGRAVHVERVLAAHLVAS
ncbi:MAG: acyl-CoA dehydrogenase family protein [Nocardioides sp.]